jgi:hypothetical protein
MGPHFTIRCNVAVAVEGHGGTCPETSEGAVPLTCTTLFQRRCAGIGTLAVVLAEIA